MGPAPNSAEGSECKIRLIKKDTAGCDWASEPRHGLYNFYKKWVTWQDLFWEGAEIFEENPGNLTLVLVPCRMER